MTITYRTIKGSELTYAEVDENFATITAQYDSVVAAVGDVNQSAADAANSAASAAQSAISADSSADAAAASETSAFNSAASATASQVAVTDLYDQFDDRYLGSKAVAPTLDNDGNALRTGALYWNSVSNKMFVWTGSMWADVVASNASTVQFTPTGGVSATNVQNAIAEIDAEKAPINSPSFSGSPSSPTPAQFDNTTKLATTEFVQRALGSLSGFSYSGTRTLTAADSGKLSGISTSGTVLTLPVGSTLPAGASFHFWNGTSTGTGTVQRQGSDVIYLADSPVTSVAVNGGETLSLTWSGTAWYAIAGSSTLSKASRSFGASLAANGYQKLPSGLIIQWGVFTVTPANTFLSFSLPIAFPNTFAQVIAQHQNSADASNFSNYNVSPLNNSQIRASASIPSTLSYIAVGY